MSLRRIKRSICLMGVFILIASFLPSFPSKAHAALGDRFMFSSPIYGVNESDGSITLTVIRKDHIEEGAIVHFGVGYAGSRPAEPGKDYDAKASTGSLTFAAGQDTKTITIPIFEDNIAESYESGFLQYDAEPFSIELYQTEAGFAVADTWVYIWDNDNGKPEPAGTLLLSSFISVGEADGFASVYVWRLRGSSGEVNVDYEAAVATKPSSYGSPASANEDFTPVSGTLTFADGEWWKRIDVPIINDSIDEGSELFNVVLRNPTGGAVVDTRWEALVVIANGKSSVPQEVPNTISFINNDLDVMEQEGSSLIKITRDYPTNDTITIDYATSDYNARSGSDYEAVSGKLTFGPGETVKTILVPIKEDDLLENDEYFVITIGNPVGGKGYIPQHEIHVKIVDNERATVSFTKRVYNAIEEQKKAQLTVIRTGSTIGAVSVSLVYESGTAQYGKDLYQAPQVVTFKAGETEKVIDIPLIDDGLREYKESFKVRLSDPSPTDSVTIGIPAAEVFIFDEDHLPRS
ncbi:Calx-beta domain-containing protein [Paenibacillus solisilvae]|uniref:Calx-beta domain-containing protein n=1 Tax=Paenibacillus solisilvae TaxID=2486751 RepID=A0ABW0VX75_9BACL